MRVPNNQDQIAQRISNQFNLDAIGDDGNVCVNNENVSENIVEQIRQLEKRVAEFEAWERSSVMN